MRVVLLCFIYLVMTACPYVVDGQSAKKYHNEWINYHQEYIKIPVSDDGIHKIAVETLPASFKDADPNRFQIWNKGRQIGILNANKTEIVFYGQKNTGSSDSALYRPSTGRLNPYISMFSDKSAYFLTVANLGNRAMSTDNDSFSGDIENFHSQSDIYKFTDQFAFATYGTESSLNHSYYVPGNNFTSAIYAGDSGIVNQLVKGRGFIKELKLVDWAGSEWESPSVELLVNGLQEGAHQIFVSQSKSLSKVDFEENPSFSIIGLDAKKTTFRVNHRNIADQSKFYLKVESRANSKSDWFGIGYIKVSYLQFTDLGLGINAKKSAVYTYLPTEKSFSRIRIKNANANFKILDITDPLLPVIVGARLTPEGMEAMVKRKAGSPLILYVYDSTSEVKAIEPKSLTKANFTPYYTSNELKKDSVIKPSDYDYLVVTTEKLSQSAIEYARYRSSNLGGKYRTLVMDINSLYDQFNYGESSPLGVRNFVDYMLSSGVRSPNHNLLLVGTSISNPNNLKKDLVGEIPTFGDPGSDILLVAGLQGSNIDVPAIPVGRISALTDADVRNYLDKVKIYEGEVDLSWKKNVLHLSGGQSTSEIIQLKNILEELSPLVRDGELGGNVEAFVKKNPAGVEMVNIASQVNSGVGMITYFGHGSISTTDLNLGYVTDVNRGYEMTNMYPLMYFNGCGVGNIFYRPGTVAMSADWLLAPKKGAIGVIANSYLSYVSSSSKHLKELYKELYANDEEVTMGQSLVNVAKSVVSMNPNSYDIANIHQTNLQGDPAVRLSRSSLPDYALKKNESIKIFAESDVVKIQDSPTLKIEVKIDNKGKNIKGQLLPIEVDVFYLDGSSVSEKESISLTTSTEVFALSIKNTKSISRITVTLDPGGSLKESSTENNEDELIVEWDIAKELTDYPSESLRDLTPPVLQVNFDNRIIADNEVVSANSIVNFILSDNKALSGEVDSTLIDVYIKMCPEENCSPLRLTYYRDLKLLRPVGNQLNVQYHLNGLPAGEYEIVVSARDLSGNTFLRPFRLRFRVQEGEDKLKVTASPNPASTFVKFQLKKDGVQSIKYYIFNSTGVAVHSHVVRVNSHDTNEWYWFPEVNSGLYYYKITVAENNGAVEEVSGKLAIVK
jgi:hypothetical protein